MAVVEPIRLELIAAAPAERAFALFTRELGNWWPAAYTWSQESLTRIEIEPFEGGRCVERGPHGFQCDWGRVLACEPPRRLVFTWQIAPDRVPQPNPALASEVEVRFEADGSGGTGVAVEHRGFERHGEGGAAYREGMASDAGWSLLLARFGEIAAGSG